MSYIKLVQRFWKASLLTILLLTAYFILYRIYMARVSAFGCFDDCFNIAAGYFINEGKSLYSDIFFNHQMLMPHISAFIQQLNPVNVYELILRHRQFILIFSFVFNLLLILRFGLSMALFALFFEFSKFYVFGDRFLAEAIIVYPLIYLSSLIFYKVLKRKILLMDYFLASVFAWFIIFMREPFVPLAVFLLVIIFYGKLQRSKVISLAVFIALVTVTLLLTPLKDYFQNVIVVNSTIFKGGIGLSSLLRSYFYPFYVVLSSERNPLMLILTPITLAFILYAFNLVRSKYYALAAIITVILGLANIRSTEPGKIFYESFHLLPWYGLLISFTFLSIFTFFKKYLVVTIVLLLGCFLLYIPRSFLVEKADPHGEFITNYGHILEVGNVFSIIKEDGDTYFADGFDELTHWQVDIPSTYRYSWYTSFMPRFENYSDARLEMFSDNPPVFYYGSCPKEKNEERLMPQQYKNLYKNLSRENKATCLYVREDKKIKEEKLEKLKREFNLTL